MQLQRNSNQTLHPLLSTSHQLLIAVGEGPNEIPGKLFRLERNDDHWEQIGETIPCVFGKKGWANGLEDLEIQSDLPKKREGDLKTPMGVFTLGTAFGYTSFSDVDFTVMPYLSVNETIKAVDDPKSRFYNQIINVNLIDNKDWNSAEDMKREDDLYKWGVVINYNTSNIDPEAGSCIYMHLWHDEKTGTAGCTAMEEENFLEVLKWLDPDKRPVLVQTTDDLFDQFIEAAGLQTTK